MGQIIKIKPSELIEKVPTLDDFYNDMNKHNNAAYSRRGEYVIELELENGSSEEDGVITVWKPQEVQRPEYRDQGLYIPNSDPDNKYYWIAVGRRRIEDYDPDHAETIVQNDHHFEETINASYFDYDGAREKAIVEFIDENDGENNN